jgi:hypothetical protein
MTSQFHRLLCATSMLSAIVVCGIGPADAGPNDAMPNSIGNIAPMRSDFGRAGDVPGVPRDFGSERTTVPPRANRPNTPGEGIRDVHDSPPPTGSGRAPRNNASKPPGKPSLQPASTTPAANAARTNTNVPLPPTDPRASGLPSTGSGDSAAVPPGPRLDARDPAGRPTSLGALPPLVPPRDSSIPLREGDKSSAGLAGGAAGVDTSRNAPGKSDDRISSGDDPILDRFWELAAAIGPEAAGLRLVAEMLEGLKEGKGPLAAGFAAQARLFPDRRGAGQFDKDNTPFARRIYPHGSDDDGRPGIGGGWIGGAPGQPSSPSGKVSSEGGTGAGNNTRERAEEAGYELMYDRRRNADGSYETRYQHKESGRTVVITESRSSDGRDTTAVVQTGAGETTARRYSEAPGEDLFTTQVTEHHNRASYETRMGRRTLVTPVSTMSCINMECRRGTREFWTHPPGPRTPREEGSGRPSGGGYANVLRWFGGRAIRCDFFGCVDYGEKKGWIGDPGGPDDGSETTTVSSGRGTRPSDATDPCVEGDCASGGGGTSGGGRVGPSDLGWGPDGTWVGPGSSGVGGPPAPGPGAGGAGTGGR